MRVLEGLSAGDRPSYARWDFANRRVEPGTRLAGMSSDFASVSAAVAELAAQWRRDRPSRQQRRNLDPTDFDALRSAGFLDLAVPCDHGGRWVDLATSARPMAELLRNLATGDPSVALVASMHPTVVAFWLLNDVADERWQDQRRAVFDSAMAGKQWGTITSEPGSGGDITRTKSIAAPAPDLDPCLPGDAYRISGDKHFGSGSGITSYMLTTGLPQGSDEPAMFVLDVSTQPWERNAGMTLTAEWDGIGMSATQSHGMHLTDMPATMVAWNGPMRELTRHVAPFLAVTFTAVVLGVLDEAVRTARLQIIDRGDTLRAFEETEWTRADSEHWLAVQAYEGALRALEAGDPSKGIHAGLRAKQNVAELAEQALLRIGRVLGGGTFSARSPFSHWFEDVRALGFLRPPWGLAYDGLYSTSLTVDQ